MFHCCGWSYPWAVVAVGGTQICLRKVEPPVIFRLIAEHRVTHLCGAPIVLNMLAHAPADQRVAFDHTVTVATGGAAPPSAVFRSMEALGFRVIHLYGATETYGPATSCVFQPEWHALPLDDRYARMARQGVAYPMVEDVRVAEPVDHDLRAPGRNDRRRDHGSRQYRHEGLSQERDCDRKDTGRTAGVCPEILPSWHADGAIEIKDRSKDIIISGGENISSLEVEEVLTQHPAIMEAAVVARPDPTWGETPCAFLELKPSAPQPDDADDPGLLSRAPGALQGAEDRCFRPLPKTSTGKSPEISAARTGIFAVSRDARQSRAILSTIGIAEYHRRERGSDFGICHEPLVYVLNGPNLNLLGKRQPTSTAMKLSPMSRPIAARSPRTRI